MTQQKQQMPRMGKTEEDWNGLKVGFLKTVQPNSFSKLIPAACNFKNNARETYLFVMCNHQLYSVSNSSLTPTVKVL